MNTIKFYASAEEFASALNGKVVNKHSQLYGISVRSQAALQRFAGVSTIDEARKMFEFGDAAAAAKIRAEGDFIKPAEEHKPILRSAVCGCLPNVPNYLRGVPTQMYQIKSNSRKKPVIDIYVEATIYDGINESKLAKKCAALANAIAAVELAGYRINLYAVCACKNSYNSCGVCVNIKQADAPLNLLNIAFPLTNKAFCRAVFLRWVDVNVNHTIHSSSSNYGHMVGVDRIKDLFGIKDGLFLSVAKLTDRDVSQQELEKQINEYIVGI